MHDSIQLNRYLPSAHNALGNKLSSQASLAEKKKNFFWQNQKLNNLKYISKHWKSTNHHNRNSFKEDLVYEIQKYREHQLKDFVSHLLALCRSDRLVSDAHS